MAKQRDLDLTTNTHKTLDLSTMVGKGEIKVIWPDRTIRNFGASNPSIDELI